MITRNEYPRPQFRRDDWQNLNGSWQFCFDDNNDGQLHGYHLGATNFDRTINVPFAYQYPASGINDQTVHEVLWYKRSFEVDTRNADKRALLWFGGVDYLADVWLNGHHVATHKGAYTAFCTDVTKYLCQQNTLVVRAYDPLDDDNPRGKQSWRDGKPFSCFYTPSSGIWQSVWLEFVGEDNIADYLLRPDFDHMAFGGEITTANGVADKLTLTATFEGKVVVEQSIAFGGKHVDYYVKLPVTAFDGYDWSPENPRLVYVDFALYSGGKLVDLTHTRFGMCKISVDEYGKLCLNGRPYYQRLVLDQGYWKESGITAPSAEALKRDIELAKAMGFNGARKHQKTEDPYYCYYAEELGFLTWCEMPSAYRYNAKEVTNLAEEWAEIVTTARNATSNVCYVPVNESWGVRNIPTDKAQQNFARSLYYLTKALDPERLVSTNDGFEAVNPTDILGVHDYDSETAAHFAKYDGGYDGMHPQGFALFADGEFYQGQPVLLSEFGGRAMKSDAKDGAWGYSGAAANVDEFLSQLSGILDGVYSHNFQGYCYTQLTDVQQEVNGLLTEDRQPKVALDTLKRIFEGK